MPANVCAINEIRSRAKWRSHCTTASHPSLLDGGLYDEKNLDDRLGRLCLRGSGCRSIVAGAANFGATGSAVCSRTRAAATDAHSAGGSAWCVDESRQPNGHRLYSTQSPELGRSYIDARSCWDGRFEVR